MPYRILLVDASPEDREVYGRFLSKGSPDKYRIVGAGSIGEGLRAYRKEAIDLILLEYRLPDGTGLDLIEEGEIDCPIVVLTGRGNERIAVEMMKAGAADYLVKGDLSADLLRHAVRSAIEKHSLRAKIERAREERCLIANIALRFQKSLNLSEILATATTEIRGVFGADRVLVYRFHPGSGGSIVAGSTATPWTECPMIPIEDTYLRGNGLAEYLAGKVKAIADVGAMNYPRCYLELLRRFEVRSHSIAPILLGSPESESERLWGLLIVHQCSGPRRWLESEIECLRQLSVQLGGAIARAELYESARERNERLERSLARRARERFEKSPRPTDGMGERIDGNGLVDRGSEFDRASDTAGDSAGPRSRPDSLFREREPAEIALKSIDSAVIITDALGRVSYLNPIAERLLGCRGEEAAGNFLSDIFARPGEKTRETRENPVDPGPREPRTVWLEGETRSLARDGRVFAVASSAAPIFDRSGKPRGSVLVFNDVTADRLLARQLQLQAERDALTGLFNRFYFERELDRAIAEVMTDPTLDHTLCYLDLDRFQIVNDTLGHAAGDELLRQLSAVIGEQIRPTDTLARLGGDEFAAILYRCPLDRAREIAGAILSAIRAFQFVRDGKIFKVGVSIGLVVIDATVESPATLMGAAEAAGYAAKEAGRDRFYIYRENDEIFRRMREERQWVLEIRGAIEENRLCLYHQAIVPARRERTEPPLSEVLLRLKLADGRLVSPTVFLPAAERYGLMPEIDRTVLGLLFRYLEGRSGESPADRPCYLVNLSGASVSDRGFLEFIIGEMRSRAIPPGAIGFEITETVAISNFAVARESIGRLHEFGCRFALDDFGSGMSSFGYLKNLPVDYLKIDGYFVRNLLEEPLDRAIVSSINEIASLLGIRTIAEFVENEAIRERAIEIGIDYVQGHGISPVLPLVNPD